MKQPMPYLFDTKKRIIVITGHYGSGKTEFAVNLALALKNDEMHCPFKEVSLVDLDVANPYFRSRERTEILEASGIQVFGSAYRGEITAELPALSASIRTPLENPDCCAILDIGGNDSGARVLKQFRKYFQTEESILLTVINRNRPETRNLNGALKHLYAIETELETEVKGLINNTHLLRETTAEDIKKGHELCKALSEKTGKPIICDTFPEPLVSEQELEFLDTLIFPLQLYMRPEWLDK